ncbi:hypothetical protein RO3G_04316 [Rhizopus delemar RA 99-880]|uniref:Uncharacterized protein n=1 Tax=Rhizopus delemar (strain RA 99-880 / ATCC MYA-4621 / FGSC 9543 / NRRL 43880) TaxID=246409 RepID=I1BTT1_RHIO9|nr:hypothetical protein RO3G_04316 [Rhizopus delemar RA 99-880]|eukprot:EIE79611.1 hypothetical protein RO3G_04316 [Rhizopus delemar RA 99-880]
MSSSFSFSIRVGQAEDSLLSIVDQITKIIPQSQHQAAMDSHLNGAPEGHNFRQNF